jgi:hypothetical protein
MSMRVVDGSRGVCAPPDCQRFVCVIVTDYVLNNYWHWGSCESRATHALLPVRFVPAARFTGLATARSLSGVENMICRAPGAGHCNSTAAQLSLGDGRQKFSAFGTVLPTRGRFAGVWALMPTVSHRAKARPGGGHRSEHQVACVFLR